MNNEILMLFAFVAMALLAMSRVRTVGGSAQDLFPIEDRIDALLKNAGVTYSPDSAMPAGVQEALTAGNEIDAIKAYRDATGVGLKEAKDAIESKGASGTQRVIGKLDALMKSLGVKYDPASGLQASIDNAIRNGDKIEAIKLYRVANGVGLKEAKDAIEAKMRGFS